MTYPPPNPYQPPDPNQQPYDQFGTPPPYPQGYAPPPNDVPPVNPMPGYPGPAYGQSYPYGQPYPMTPTASTNGLAIASLVVSISTLMTCLIGSIVGVVLGHIALNQIKRTGQQGRGLALAGVIVGYVLGALWIVYFVGILVFANHFGDP